MVGAQNAINSASNLFPCRKIYSETMMIDNTTKSMIAFMTPIRSRKFLIILRKVIPTKDTKIDSRAL